MNPMLARLVRMLPDGGGGYFPELVAAFARLDAERWTMDGEVLVTVDGRFKFEALMARLHPAASRVRELAVRTPASADPPEVWSLLLGLYDEAGGLEHIGVASSFSKAAKLLRWRADRDPAACRIEQLDAPAPDVGSVLGE